MATRPRVLVVDDDPLFRSLITSMLRRDYLVTVAGDGAEGYYKALEFPPQLAIVDIQMPGWDGLRTLQAMQAHQALAKIPVMILTSDASRQTVLAAIQSGANDYVIKTTLNREDLLKKVQRLLKLPAGKPGTPAPVSTTADPDALSVGPAIAAEDDGAVSAAPSGPDIEAATLQAMVDNWE
ncbi:MAG: response regulator [Planctomycetia bacterium]|nr:response regulator [Planctomycetia bacterium]